MYNHYRTVCVTRFHRFHSLTRPTCVPTRSSALQAFLHFSFKGRKRWSRASCARGQQCSARILPDRVVLTEGAALVWNRTVSWGGQSEDAGARPPTGLRRWALFDPPPAETTSLRNIVHVSCSRAAGPADQGHGVQVNSTGSGRALCLGFFLFSVVWPTAYSRSAWGSVLMFLRSWSLRASSISETVALNIKKMKRSVQLHARDSEVASLKGFNTDMYWCSCLCLLNPIKNATLNFL